MPPKKPFLTLVPLARPHHPPVRHKGKTYDPSCEQFVHLNARGEFLYFEPDTGYFTVRHVGGCMVGGPGRPLKRFGATYAACPLVPDLL